MRHEPLTIGKMHISVQEMIAEAREIIKPAHKRESLLINNNFHMQNHSSNGRIKDHLRQILHMPEQSYKKIGRQRRKSLVKFNTMEKDEQAPERKVNETYNSISPIMMAKLTDRYRMKTIIHNFQSELIDQKFHHNMRKQSRPLCNKNTVSLLPEPLELPNLKSKNSSIYQQKQASADNSTKGSPKIYLTITQQDIVRARERLKQHKIVAHRYPNTINQLIEQSRSRQKHARSFKSQQSSINPEGKNSITNKRQKDNQLKLPQQQKYEPWSLDAQYLNYGDTLY